MGIYIFKTQVLRDLLADRSKEDFGRQIIPAAIETAHLDAFEFDGYWEDIGTIRNFYEANLALTQCCPQFNFYDEDAPIYTHPRHLPAARLETCRVENSIISEGCVIERADISNSVIGVRTLIGSGTTISDSIIMGLDYFENEERRQGCHADVPVGIGRDCHIKGALLDKNCRLGDGVCIDSGRYSEDRDEPLFVVRDGIVIIPRATTLPSGTVI